MNRRISASILITGMVTSLLTGCGGTTAGTGSSSDTTGKVSASTQTTAAATEKSASSGGDVVEIEYLNHKTETEAINAMDKLIQKFESENPNIKVTQTTAPDFNTVIKTRAQTNDMPDVFSCSTNNTYEKMYADGLIMDLTGKDFLSNVSEESLKLSEYQGKNWRLPYSLSLYGLYIRSDIFEKNGLKAPTTYEELMKDCETLKSNGVTPFICADQDSGVVGQRMERLMGIIDDTDDEFKKIAAGEMEPKDSTVLNTYAKAQIDIANNTTDDSMGVDQESSYQNFVNGEGAMLINGTWTLATLKNYDPDIKVSVIPFPNPTGKETKVPISIDTSFCISAETKHPAECLKFLEFLSKTENAQIYCDGEGSPNVVNGVTYNKGEFKPIMEAVNSGKMFVSLNAIWPSGLRNEMRDAASNLIIDKDAKEFVETAGSIIPDYYNNAK
ncbi:MAG: extracellular solute-binding protein [Lachnospira sp.]|nr:extracellular solute-binding protein [Lachnospira sp.]